MYKDIRSIKSWMKRKSESAMHNAEPCLFTLESLTPEKIAGIIREYYNDPANDKSPEWLKKQRANHPQVIRKNDADDPNLIWLILFVIDHILTARIYNRKSLDKVSGAVSVSTSTLRMIITNPSDIAHIMEVARTVSIVTMVTEYVHTTTEQQARTYRIHVGHLNKPDNPLVQVKCPDKNIAEKIISFKMKNDLNDDTRKVLLASMYQLYHLRVDNNKALEALQSRLDKDLRRTQLLRVLMHEDEPVDTLDIINHRYINGLISLKKVCSDKILDKHIKFDQSGRIHSNLTNFPKEIRHLLSFVGSGEPLAMIDMANSQPFLLINLIMKYMSEERGKKITTRKQLEKYCQKKGYNDVMQYVGVVENAAFYKECYRLFKGRKKLKEITPAQKERVRKMIYTMVFFGDGSANWIAGQRLADAFANEYPKVMEIINHYRNQENPTNLSDRLQREESKLFIDDILTKLIVREKRPHILSLHDGILCPEKDIQCVIEKFERAFAKSKFQVKVKIDLYRTGETKVILINDHNVVVPDIYQK